MKPRTGPKFLAAQIVRAVVYSTLFLGLLTGMAAAQVFFSFEEISQPTQGNAEEPSLLALPDGRVLMTWTELADPTYPSVKVAILDDATWSPAVIVAQGADIFVNYADFPAAAVLADSTLAVHWMTMNATTSYAYETNIALSGDGGLTWGEPITPHRDGTAQQHGFVSMLQDGAGGLLAMWLDGRAYGTDAASGDAMQLRATTLSTDGTLSEETLVDDRTCSCCQTTATILDNGTVLLAYRDRTADEIRDISLVRRVDGQWSDPVAISQDGWEIAGCPVNGPAIDANGGRVVLVWFTAPDGLPAVRVAFSDDRGHSFSTPIGVDLGSPVGGVDALQLADGSALVSWLERSADGEALMICRALPGAACSEPATLTLSRSGHTMGFPRMAAVGNDIYVAWSEPSRDEDGTPNGGTIVRAAHGVVVTPD